MIKFVRVDDRERLANECFGRDDDRERASSIGTMVAMNHCMFNRNVDRDEQLNLRTQERTKRNNQSKETRMVMLIDRRD
jgi:hypothetical protein